MLKFGAFDCAYSGGVPEGVDDGVLLGVPFVSKAPVTAGCVPLANPLPVFKVTYKIKDIIAMIHLFLL